MVPLNIDLQICDFQNSLNKWAFLTVPFLRLDVDCPILRFCCFAVTNLVSKKGNPIEAARRVSVWIKAVAMKADIITKAKKAFLSRKKKVFPWWLDSKPIYF